MTINNTIFIIKNLEIMMKRDRLMKENHYGVVGDFLFKVQIYIGYLQSLVQKIVYGCSV